jgi:multiple antibiotic resistance protein
MASLLFQFFMLAFSALLPLVNPLGSALVLMGLVGPAPEEVYRKLARRVAINMVLFLVVIELVGAGVLAFFGISLPVVQVAGGFVISAIGWKLLNGEDNLKAAEEPAAVEIPELISTWEPKAFYPLTFPVTTGPGCIVVMLTVTAHAQTHRVVDTVVSHAGVFLAVAALGVLVYFSYAYAPKITKRIPPPTAQGILRVIAFVLLCIGVQIAWNGAVGLLATLPVH